MSINKKAPSGGKDPNAVELLGSLTARFESYLLLCWAPWDEYSFGDI